MPKLKLNFPPQRNGWTKVPNHLVDSLLPGLTDTEFRVLVILLRLTVGWNRPQAVVFVPHRKLMRLTGRSSETVGKALKSLVGRGLVHKAGSLKYQVLKQPVSGTDTQQYKDSS